MKTSFSYENGGDENSSGKKASFSYESNGAVKSRWVSYIIVLLLGIAAGYFVSNTIDKYSSAFDFLKAGTKFISSVGSTNQEKASNEALQKENQTLKDKVSSLEAEKSALEAFRETALVSMDKMKRDISNYKEYLRKLRGDSPK